MNKKMIISIVVGMIFLGASLIGLFQFLSLPASSNKNQTPFIFSNATALANLYFSGNFIIYNTNNQTLNTVEELQKNSTIIYFNIVNSQIIGKIKPANIEVLKKFNASVEATINFSEPIEFFWYNTNFYIDPKNFQPITTYIPINFINFSSNPPKAKMSILASFSRNLSVVSYTISLYGSPI
ncbi:MAG: hypothetical protein ACP5HJ_00370 [Candidatus Micrarchaeia archaeon]